MVAGNNSALMSSARKVLRSVTSMPMVEASRRDLGFEPLTTIEEGLPRFVAWYRDYHGV